MVNIFTQPKEFASHFYFCVFLLQFPHPWTAMRDGLGFSRWKIGVQWVAVKDCGPGVGIAAVPGGSPANVITPSSIRAVPVPLDEGEGFVWICRLWRDNLCRMRMQELRHFHVDWFAHLCRWMPKLATHTDNLLHEDLPGRPQLHVSGTYTVRKQVSEWYTCDRATVLTAKVLW